MDSRRQPAAGQWGARSGRACRLGSRPRSVNRRAGKGPPRRRHPGVAGGRARRGGRCAQSVQAPARLTRPRQHRPHPRPCCRRFESGKAGCPRGGRASPGASPGRRRGEVPPGGVWTPEARCAAEPEVAGSRACRSRRALLPRKGFLFQRKEGRTTPSFPLPPPCPGSRTGPCPGRRRRQQQPSGRDFPGTLATRAQSVSLLCPSSWFLQALQEAESCNPSPLPEEPLAFCGPRARSAPPGLRRLRVPSAPRRWMA